ncbi:PREDICTED: odorant receptor 59a-like [Rhagoletis zephyria]|uniref:odorant receptor 59a-like n=1 Tax=Rhagoletis zephyria TaxID=28612 RepID=UPI0008119EFF|nr:PREDICTED: odorant receptor 59a-like [Rhagoletis zephyria]
MNRSPVNSRYFFRIHWRYWLMLGCVRQPVLRYQLLYSFYSICINLIIIVLYPGIVFLSLFNSTNLTDILQVLPLCAGSFTASFKYISYYKKLELVRELEQVFSNLDARIQLAEDRKYFADIQRRTDFIMNASRGMCTFFFAVTLMSFAASIGERRLAFEIAMPFFDYRASTTAYIAAVGIELGLLVFDLLQALVNDTFPAVALCVLSDHTHLLGERLARIGHSSEDVRANIAELQRCIIDHQYLYR